MTITPQEQYEKLAQHSLHLEAFKIKRHFRSLCSILQYHGEPIPKEDEMPAIGYCVSRGNEPVAFAFVRRVEGGFGQVDGLTSNPHIPGELRHIALDALIQRCIDSARFNDIKSLIAFTKSSATLERSLRNGFQELPHNIVVHTLKKD